MGQGKQAFRRTDVRRAICAAPGLMLKACELSGMGEIVPTGESIRYKDTSLMGALTGDSRDSR